MNSKTKRVTTIGMLCAITYVTMVVGRIPIILFLKYDPSDVIVTLGGFIWGPMTSCIVSVIVATLEMITVSDNAIQLVHIRVAACHKDDWHFGKCANLGAERKATGPR